jgi:hypothetical protein
VSGGAARALPAGVALEALGARLPGETSRTRGARGTSATGGAAGANCILKKNHKNNLVSRSGSCNLGCAEIERPTPDNNNNDFDQ